MSTRPTSQLILPLINVGTQRRAEHEHNSDDDFTLSPLTSASIGDFFVLTENDTRQLKEDRPITFNRLKAGVEPGKNEAAFGVYKLDDNWVDGFTFYQGKALWDTVQSDPRDPVSRKPLRKFDWVQLRNAYSTEAETPDLSDKQFTWPPGIMTDHIIHNAVAEVLKDGVSPHWEHRIHGPIATWDVSNVTNMSFMFRKAASFNGDLSTWQVSKVIEMQQMFEGAASFNGDLSTWNVGNVTNIHSMFERAASFKGDLSNWDVKNVTNMGFMFGNVTAFDCNLNNWDVSKVTNMQGMFERAASFKGDLSNWDVSKVTSMLLMFDGAASFNGDLSTWNVGNVENMFRMFADATMFNSDLSEWDMRSVTNTLLMFTNAGIDSSHKPDPAKRRNVK